MRKRSESRTRRVPQTLIFECLKNQMRCTWMWTVVEEYLECASEAWLLPSRP
jgi:hypothetical protein